MCLAAEIVVTVKVSSDGDVERVQSIVSFFTKGPRGNAGEGGSKGGASEGAYGVVVTSEQQVGKSEGVQGTVAKPPEAV